MGKQQLYELGQYLRRRYNVILGAKYSPNKVYIQSTDVDRTLMSAEACLAGLYMPTADEIWNNEILWQPVPVASYISSILFALFHFILFLFLGSHSAKTSRRKSFSWKSLS